MDLLHFSSGLHPRLQGNVRDSVRRQGLPEAHGQGRRGDKGDQHTHIRRLRLLRDPVRTRARSGVAGRGGLPHPPLPHPRREGDPAEDNLPARSPAPPPPLLARGDERRRAYRRELPPLRGLDALVLPQGRPDALPRHEHLYEGPPRVRPRTALGTRRNRPRMGLGRPDALALATHRPDDGQPGLHDPVLLRMVRQHRMGPWRLQDARSAEKGEDAERRRGVHAHHLVREGQHRHHRPRDPQGDEGAPRRHDPPLHERGAQVRLRRCVLPHPRRRVACRLRRRHARPLRQG